MVAPFRPWFRSRETAQETRPPSVPPGQLVYAVGDIHGRLDMLRVMAQAIERDIAARPGLRPTVVLLGDLIDRGPDSAGVIAFVREWQRQRDLRILMGNHEDMLLQSLAEVEVLPRFVRFGGRETLESFGIDPLACATAPYAELHRLMIAAIPEDTVDFICHFANQVEIGDYLFVHAGIRPGVALDAQREEDLRWIRDPFLASKADHGRVVIHGHTVTEEPEIRANRIGIDTGAYFTGVLTALALAGERRRLIEVRAQGDGFAVAEAEIRRLG